MSDQGVIHPDTHIFSQPDLYQSEPDVVADIMTQISLKVGWREWGDKYHTSATSVMKQLHFRKTFTPMHLKQLTYDQRMKLLESHMFLKEKRIDRKIKGKIVDGVNK